MGFYGFYGFGGGYGRRFGGGSRKKKKQPKDNWFERLNQTQIKDLLAAARMPVSGTKKVQMCAPWRTHAMQLTHCTV